MHLSSVDKMSWPRPELVALSIIVATIMLLNGLIVSVNANPTRTAIGITNAADQQQQLETLRIQKQLVQSELTRLYMQAYRPETPLLTEELQQRQQQIQLQIEILEGNMHNTQKPSEAQHRLALNLSADFDYLQQKLNELKQQLDDLQAKNSSKQPIEAARDAISTINSTPKPPTGTNAATASSYFWKPWVTMPGGYPSGSIAPPATQTSPPLIKRLLSLLRPRTTANQIAPKDHWSEQTQPTKSSTTNSVEHLSAEELLQQLQLQRQFLDDAIKRLEQLAAKQNVNKH